NVGAKRGCGDIAHHRHKVQNRVEADGLLRAGDDEQSLKQMFQGLDALADRCGIGAQGREWEALIAQYRHFTDCLAAVAGRSACDARSGSRRSLESGPKPVTSAQARRLE